MNQYEFVLNGINYSIINESKITRNGFKHESTLYKKFKKTNIAFYQFEFEKIHQAKAFYINRTWEAFQYESVMKKLINTYFLSADDIKEIYKQIGIESL